MAVYLISCCNLCLQFFPFQFFISELWLIDRVEPKPGHLATFVVWVFTHFHVVESVWAALIKRSLCWFPIFLGLKVLLLGDSDGEAIAKDGLRKDNKNLIFLVAMITFASCGADNIGVFVPYFTTLNLANLIVALLTFLVMIYLLVFSAQKLAQVPSVGETLEKYSRWFIAVVYLGLGMYILIENNSFDMLWAVLG